MNEEILKRQITVHEGRVEEIYIDSLGYATFGIGHLIKESDPEYGQPEGTPVSPERVKEVFDIDFDLHVEETKHLCEERDIDFEALPEAIQHTLVDMCFNLGKNRLGKFNNMLNACKNNDWVEMAAQMKDSRWYAQVGVRSEFLVREVLNQEHPTNDESEDEVRAEPAPEA